MLNDEIEIILRLYKVENIFGNYSLSGYVISAPFAAGSFVNVHYITYYPTASYLPAWMETCTQDEGFSLGVLTQLNAAI